MTPEQQMYAIILKALGDGIAKLVRNGLAFTVMTLAIAGLCGGIYYLIILREAEIASWKKELAEYRETTDNRMNLLQTRIYECDNERKLLAIEVAELRAIIKYSVNKKR